MSELSTARVTSAIKPDGFVDFYELVDQPDNTSTDGLRTQINALYADAQANRDHRNIARRREYEMLLELLPFARTVLLDPQKRARYDTYAQSARAGTASQDFESFMDTLTGKSESDAEERASLLGLQDNAAPQNTTTANARTSAAASAKPATKAAPARKAVAPAAQASLTGTAISVAVFFIVLLVAQFGLKLGWPVALLAGAALGVVTWVVTHKAAGKVSV